MFFSFFTNTNTPSVVEALNRLIDMCQDSAHILRVTAEGMSSDLLSHLFASYAEQRTQFAIALKAEVRRQGSTSPPTGGLSETLQWGWNTMKAALSNGDEKPLIHACINSEHATLDAYQQARQSNLPADVLHLINRQYQELVLVHQNIRRIEERMEVLI